MSRTPGPTPRHRPEITRLARVLGVDESDLSTLEQIPEEDLATLHRQVNHALFGQGQQAFARVANLSRTIPAPMAGKLAEKFLPPVLAARVAEQLSPAKARDLVGRVSVDYLAELAIALDPIGARPVIEEIPDERIGQVARALFEREEYFAMADFARCVTPDGLLAALDAASPRDLAAILPLLDWDETLDEVVARLSPAKIDEVVAGLTSPELVELAIAVDLTPLRPILDHLSDEKVAEVAHELLDRDEYAALAELAAAIPPSLLAVAVGVASPADLAEILPLLDRDTPLEEVLDHLSPEQVDEIVGGLSAEQLADLAVAIDLEPLRPVLDRIDSEAVAGAARELFDRQEYAALAELATTIPPSLLPTAIGVAERADLEAVLEHLPPGPEREAALEAMA